MTINKRETSCSPSIEPHRPQRGVVVLFIQITDNIHVNKVTKYQLKKEMHTTIWLGNEEPLQKFLQFSFLPRLQSCGLEVFSKKYMGWRMN